MSDTKRFYIGGKEVDAAAMEDHKNKPSSPPRGPLQSIPLGDGVRYCIPARLIMFDAQEDYEDYDDWYANGCHETRALGLSVIQLDRILKAADIIERGLEK